MQPNDNYWIISKKVYGNGGYFKAIYEHNRRQHPKADRLQVGETLETPDVAYLQKTYPDLCPTPGHASQGEIDALRQLISKGAKTIDARSNEPDAALNALQDLEEQVLAPYTAKWLFSFTGAASHQVRKELFKIFAKPSPQYQVQHIDKWYNHGNGERLRAEARRKAEAREQPEDSLSESAPSGHEAGGNRL